MIKKSRALEVNASMDNMNPFQALPFSGWTGKEENHMMDKIR